MKDDGIDRVIPLRQFGDFRVAEGEPDIRGWEVRSSDGRRIGDVDELLVDTGAMKVRYLDVAVERGMVAKDDGHVLVPVASARLEHEFHRVTVDNLPFDEMRTMPLYDRGGPLTRDFADAVDARFGRGQPGGAAFAGPARAAGAAGAADAARRALEDDTRRVQADDAKRVREDDARLTLSDEELSLGKREVETGRVEIDKRVETRHVRESVPTSREEVTLERRPITDPRAAGNVRIEGDEVHIPLREEEVTVQKRVVPREELVVKKSRVVEETPVEADLRRERLDVHREGDARLRQDGTDDRPPR